jgi:GNAT superfamily N-acetyltransferase
LTQPLIVRLPDDGGQMRVTAEGLPRFQPDPILDRRIIENEGGGALALIEDAELRATGRLTLQPLDSEIYCQPMGKMVLNSAALPALSIQGTCALVAALISQAESGGLAHLVCHLPADALAERYALERQGFLLMDSSVQYRWVATDLAIEELPLLWKVRRSGGDTLRVPKFGIAFRSARRDDIDQLENLARATFTTDTRSRYVNDSRLDRDSTGALYARWVRNAIEGSFGDFTAVAVVEEQPVGFQIFRLDPDDRTKGWMGIGAVRPEWRGRAIFTGLLAAIFRWCVEHGVTTAAGRTLVQNTNMHPSCRAFGGMQETIVHGFHCWLGAAPVSEPK